jgi:hypothetical protein
VERPLQPVRPKVLPHLALCVAAVAVLLLAACSGGRSDTVPFIEASVVAFPPGAAPAGFDAGASVAVLDPWTGAPIAAATVIVNGVLLQYDAAVRVYAGGVAIAPGETVALTVAIEGQVYEASGAQFAAYPQVETPAAGAVWAAYSGHDVTWSPGVPTADAAYALAVLDARDPDDDALWPLSGPQIVPRWTTSFTIPADAVSVGDRLVVVGLTREVAIPGALAGSVLVIGGFSYTPVHVMDDLGRRWEVAVATGIPDRTTLRGVVWTGTQLVAVGSSAAFGGAYGIVLTSPDALEWTPRTAFADVGTQVLWGVASSGTQIVAVGGPGILSSSDGVTWTKRSGAEGRFLLDVVWSGAAFVAVGESGIVLTSPDGVTWAEQVSGVSHNLWAVAWTGARLVAVGAYGAVIVSDDGAAWSPATSGTTKGLGGVASSTAATVAVGPGGTVLASADGLSWSPVTSQTDDFKSIASSGQRFAAVGASGAIATSVDGTSWTARSSPRGHDLWDVAWTGTTWVAVGDIETVLLSR